MAIDTEYIRNLYRDLLGREPTEGEIAGHVENPGGESGLKSFFEGSPEYAAKHPGSTTPQTWWGGEAAQGGQMYPFDPRTSADRTDQWSGGYDIMPSESGFERLQGFDFANLRDPHMQTLKYQFARIAKDYAPTPENLKAIMNDPRFKANFPNAKLISGGAGDQIDFEGKGIGTDVGLRFDPKSNTGAAWWWGGGGGAAAGGGGGAGAGGSGVASRSLSGFGAGGFGAGGFGGGWNYPGAPSLDAPNYGGYAPFSYDKAAPGAFVAPTGADLQNEPGYQFRLDQGRKALEQSAAGRGVLRTGGTMKDLSDYAQNFASSEYGNVYNRRMGEHDQAFKEYLSGFDMAADTYGKNYQGSIDKYDRNYNEALAEFQPKMREWELGFGRNQREAELMFGREWDQYKLEQDNAMRKQEMIFNAGIPR